MGELFGASQATPRPSALLLQVANQLSLGP